MDVGGRVTQEQLPRKLYRKAKHQPTFRFYSLYDKVCRSDVLQRAYDLVKQNKGSSGIDGETFAAIETGIGRTAYLQEIQKTLKAKTYRAMPVKRVEIPMRYRHKLNNRGSAYTRFPRGFIYEHLGLYKVPTTPAWKGVHA